MGQKIIIFCCCLTLSYAATEFGRVTALSGSATISSNLEVRNAQLDSHVYLGEYIIVNDQSKLTIHSNFDTLLTIKENSNILIEDSNKFKVINGEYTSEGIPEDELNKTKSLPKALLYTAVFPGWGHYYIQDYPKALPLSITSTYLIGSLLTIDPAKSDTYHEQLANRKEQLQQIYLVYWLLCLLDITSETNSYNKKILNEKETLKVSMSYGF